MRLITMLRGLAIFLLPLAAVLTGSAGNGWADSLQATSRPSPMQIAQATSTTATPSSAEMTVSVKALLDAKVLDSTNRELGTIRGLLADPQTGKLVRADIALKRSGTFVGSSDQQLSVPWDQLTVKRQEGNLVLVMNQEAMQKIQAIEKPQTQQKK